MSNLEQTLAFHLAAAKLPVPVREHRFHPPRRWKFDFCYPDQKIAIECEGGTWTKGRHTRGKGFQDDCFKYNQATIDGWRVLRFTSDMVKSGQALQMIEGVL